ncbi:TetR/AcrR family transcriptional regulator [Lichenibacterium ramalinae]|uniref:TetR/AcrR family transcriptional regulator n=1 Tax=Lichenibacterium ramalinae TaxID=2316527 RepID=A0A4Q2R624_9HYPH|nr:TetR/AcrR family transcriptional regulator [Lichenibacterium ramalinae]RYB02016.1 TetR/AcrR family transcriptional regulator [Lichenibacterium ramalinae]
MGEKIAAVLDRATSKPGDRSPTSACCSDGKPKPRDRIVATARDMFHQHGFRPVGVEAIAEAAGTNKMTLYRHFGSKDELIVECLKSVAAEAEAQWRVLEARHAGNPRAHLVAWVREAADCVLADGRGCSLANAAVELTEAHHPARRLVELCKSAYRDRMVGLCRSAGIAQAENLADALSLLLEGARVSRQSVGAEGPSAKFVRTAEAMIAAFASEEA